MPDEDEFHKMLADSGITVTTKTWFEESEMPKESGPVIKVEHAGWGTSGVKVTFKDKSCVSVTKSHWDAIVAYVRGTPDA